MRNCSAGDPPRGRAEKTKSLVGFRSEHGGHNVYEVVQAVEVAVFSVTLHPGRPVAQLLAVRQRSGLAEIDHPYFCQFPFVVDE